MQAATDDVGPARGVHDAAVHAASSPAPTEGSVDVAASSPKRDASIDRLLDDEEPKAAAAPPPAAVPVSAIKTEVLPSPAELPQYPGVAVAGAHPMGATAPTPTGAAADDAARAAPKRRGRGAVRGATRTQRVRAARPTVPLLAAGPPIPNAPPMDGAAQSDLAALGVAPAEEEMDWASLNNDYCETCHGHGRFLCCDGCPRSFHFACVNPPLDVDEMPFPNGTLLPKRKGDAKNDPRAARADADDSWFCQVCFAARLPPKPVRNAGPFGVLVQKLERENPSIFALPAELRNYFKGVSTGADGAYVDSTSLRPLKLSRHGFVEERDAFQLRDKHGEAVLCYQCGGSALPMGDVLPPGAARAPTQAEELEALETLADAALAAQQPPRAPPHGRRMLSCDFCHLHWHLDCVDPPMQTMPPTTRRWKCPAHSSHAEPRVRIPRAANQVKTVDVPLATAPPPAARPPRPLGEVEVLADPNDRYFDHESGKGHSSEPPYDEVTVSNSNGTRLRYRIPEKTIRLEFWSRAALERAQHARRAAAAAPSTTHTPHAPFPHAPPIAPTALDRLVAVALGEARAPPHEAPAGEARTPEHLAQNAAAAHASLAPNATPFDGAMRSTYRADEAPPLAPSARHDAPPPPPVAEPLTYVYPSELGELRAIKRMLTAKGPERVRAFLQES